MIVIKTEINIVDSVMGSGKTTAMINYINDCKSSERFIFVTPYLNEIDRIRRGCKKREFSTPREKPSKLTNLKTLLMKKRNVVITHALFLNFDQCVKDLVKKGGYTLIMDEAISPLMDSEYIYPEDKRYLIEHEVIKQNKDGSYRWNGSKLAAMNIVYKRKFNKDNTFLYENSILYFYAPDYFTSFKRVFILTYLFEPCPLRAYFDFYGLKYKYIGVEMSNRRYVLCDNRVIAGGHDFANLIHVSGNDFINSIGEVPGSLSRTWYENCSEEDLERLKKNCITYFRKNTSTQSKYNMWTTFSDYRKYVKGQGYSRGFLPSNAKATNEFGKRTAAAYLINKYYQEDIRGFFEEHDIHLDNDLYATSELVQWLFRGAVRNGKEMYVYIPSKRMRELLLKWLETE